MEHATNETQLVKKTYMADPPTGLCMACMRHLIVVVALLFAAAAELFSQNNIYKINDAVYSVYKRAYNERDSERGVELADSARDMALAVGDKKGECLAYTVYLLHYFVSDDDDAFMKSVSDLKRVSRANGYPQYYYYASNIYITRLLNSGQSLFAIQENSNLQKEAFERNEHFGIMSSIRNMARIHTSRANRDLAFKYNKEALEYMLKYVPEQDPTPLYLELADYMRTKNKYKEALAYNNTGLEASHTKTTKARLMQQRCHILYNMGLYDDFKSYYPKALKMSEEAHSSDKDLRYVYMRVCAKMLENDKEGALALAEKLSRVDGQLACKAMIYESFGDYEKALDAYRSGRTITDSINLMVQASDIAAMNVQIGNQLLQDELSRKESEAMNLQLRQMKQQMDIEQQKSVNERLQMANQQLELDRLKSDKRLLDTENARQKAVLEQEKSRSLYRNHMFIIGSVSVFLIFTGLVVALIRHRIMLNKMNSKNRELEIARDQADSANKMKSVFIQNMSHEIRTPLNSIVGFSEILTTPDMDISEEEKEEYTQIIQSNSELLTTLVNDLLGLAELESGKYVINKSMARCNEMCQEAISTVIHRKPDGVDMRYCSDVDDHFMLNTDSNRVKQVLINYLTNAEKHTTEGYIELRCSVKDTPGKVTFSVTDTGTGISPEDVDKVFDRFEKLNYFEAGFGLGLSICRIIADKLDGSVRLDTSYTDGARFLFTLPIDEE
jgi:signal transduction histidine kinase